MKKLILLVAKPTIVVAVAIAVAASNGGVRAEGGSRRRGAMWGVNRGVRSQEGRTDFTSSFSSGGFTIAAAAKAGSNPCNSQPSFMITGGDYGHGIYADGGLQYKGDGWEAFINFQGGQAYAHKRGADGHWIDWRGHQSNYTLKYRVIRGQAAGAQPPNGAIGLNITGDFGGEMFALHTPYKSPPIPHISDIWPSAEDAIRIFPHTDAASISRFFVERSVAITQATGVTGEGTAPNQSGLDGTTFTCTMSGDAFPVDQKETGYDVPGSGHLSYDARWSKTKEDLEHTPVSQRMVQFPNGISYTSEKVYMTERKVARPVGRTVTPAG